MVSEQLYYLETENDSNDRAEVFALREWPCTVGRGSDCQLRLDFDRISRRHARFEALDHGVQVTDLGSTNGTFVNHDRIDEPTELHDGDIIHFADHAFRLRYRDPSGQTVAHPDHKQAQGSTDTVIGFTAAPTGFPVQAPEFFELLNDELIRATRQIMTSARGTVLAQALRGRSDHPRLGADSATLVRLSEELGEELRLAQLTRDIALKQADQARLQTDLFISIHPAECEQPEVLIDSLRADQQCFRHLTLVCELPFDAIAQTHQARELPSRIRELGLAVCATGLSLSDEPEKLPGPVDYIRVSAAGEPETIERLIERWQDIADILVDDIDDRDLVARYAQVGATLFRGSAIGPERDIDA